MKQMMFNIVRSAHVLSVRKPLPRRLAIYFHALERHDWTAFGEAIDHLTELGYRSVGPIQFLDETNDEQKLHISFDDNFRSWFSALDLFASLGVTATFYVNSLPLRDTASDDEIARYFAQIDHHGEMMTMSRAELKQIHAAGHTIGCHTHSHPMLSRLPEDLWADEIDRSKQVLEDLIGEAVVDFSYPFGMRRHFSPALRRYCADHGLATIATGIPGLQHLAAVDPLAIHRTGWKFGRSLEHNIENLAVDARIFTGLSGRSAIG